MIAGVMFLTFNSTAKEINRVFQSKGKVKVNTVSGDLKVIPGDTEEIIVNITYTFNDDEFNFDFEEDDTQLICYESFLRHSSAGISKWTITVPLDTEIIFVSSSGNFEIKNSSSDIEVQCSSGNIEAKDTKGKLNLHSSSGDVKVQNCEGVFELYSSSGDVDAKDIKIKGNSMFTSSSGNTVVVLQESLRHDISVSSSSGDAILDFNGTVIQGNVEMTARVPNGEIECPIDFKEEKKYNKQGQDYVKKSFSLGKDTPLIKISTASGDAELVQ